MNSHEDMYIDMPVFSGSEDMCQENGADHLLAQAVLDERIETGVPGGRFTTAITLLSIAAAIVLAVIIGILAISAAKRKERKKIQELRKRRNQVRYKTRRR